MKLEQAALRITAFCPGPLSVENRALVAIGREPPLPVMELGEDPLDIVQALPLMRLFATQQPMSQGSVGKFRPCGAVWRPAEGVARPPLRLRLLALNLWCLRLPTRTTVLLDHRDISAKARLNRRMRSRGPS